MGIRHLVILTTLAVPIGACSEGNAPWMGTVYDSAGVTVVLNTDMGIWAADDQWRLEEDLRIGGGEGAADQELKRVGGVAVDSNGRIFVLDRQDQSVQVYSAEGVYQQTIEVLREGPGQWGGALFVLMGPGDTLFVGNGQNRRIYRYAPNGSKVGSFGFIPEGGFPMHFTVTPSGLFAEQVRPIPAPRESEVGQPTDAIILLGPDESLTDTLITFPSGSSMALDGGMVVYAPEPVWDLSDDFQVVWGVNNSYRLSVYSEGQTNRVFGKPVERYPVVEADREAELRVLEERWVDLGLTAVGVERLRSGTRFSDLFPAFTNVAFGPAGTIWVQQVVPPSQLSVPKMAWLGGVFAGREWDVFDSEGRFLGLVNVSEPFFPLVFRGNRIYGVWNNVDQPHVARLRIVGDLGAGGT